MTRPIVVRGDARHLPLPDESVDLLVTSPPQRLKALPHDELLGSVPGTYADEQRWHLVFADLREQGEWFRDTPELRQAITDAVRAES